MLIINPDEESGRMGDAEMQILEDNSHEFQTADEIYQIMAKSCVFEGDGDKALTTSDLVILYKNIDVAAKVVPNAMQETSKSPNQYVETVIYNDDRVSEGSDFSEDISYEDLDHVFAVNKARIDLMNNFGDTLSHKFGDIEMRTSGLATEYDRHFMFNDPHIKEQLKSFYAISRSKHSDSTVLPASLLDYICCKRLEDNYNFYMDNIIQYVKNTIEQLKRISNGDYLTEKVKAKWREMDAGNSSTPECKNTVLANSVSIPLRVANKLNGQKSTWDEIVHSEMDVRSLSKILEKKVIIEVPKIICGTYRLFSKRCKDNLIITCKKDKQPAEESRVDVVLKLQRSKSGDVISNIDSIMILKSLPTLVAETESCSKDVLALEFENISAIDQKDKQQDNMIELDENNEATPITDCSEVEEIEAQKLSEDDYDLSSQCNCHEDNEYDSTLDETDFSTIGTDDLHYTIQRLSMQSPVIEESEENMKKKKLPMRVRIKSPYENKSYVIEEKKRKKLLEIREKKRDIKKNAINGNCKITKRHERSAVMAQASNSVTKLSITNKHFYNSIYGDTLNINNKHPRKYHRDPARVSIPSIKLEDGEENHLPPPPPLTTPEKNSEKYINRSYYLDNADTEIMYLETKLNESQDESKDDLESSIAVNEIDVNVNLLRQLMVPSTTDLSLTDTSSSLPLHVLCDSSSMDTNKQENEKSLLTSTRSTQVTAPTISPKIEVFTEYENCNTTSSVECRKSIDKIYDLIKKISETDSLEVVCSKTKIANNIVKLDASDSGTSVNHQLTFSNPSCSKFEKSNTSNGSKKYENPVSVISKVTINSKSQNVKCNTNNKENKKLNFRKIQDNPLKAISQLIQEFDNVQKTYNKNGFELKKNKKTESLTIEDKRSSRKNFLKKTPKQESNVRDSVANSSKLFVNKEKEKRLSPSTGYRPFRITPQPFLPAENPLDKTNRKKISDIIDEEKELRGEAVRGPPKKLNRIDSLAQPKKAYFQTQQEESQYRFGKRVTDRLSKQTPPLLNLETKITSIRSKQRNVSDGPPASTKPPHTAGPPIERLPRIKPSNLKSPSRDGNGKRSAESVSRQRFGIVNKTPEQRNGKMIDMETYIRSQHGRELHLAEIAGSHNAHKSRVPFIPNDLDLISMASSPSGVEESSVLGKKLHNMIDAMISNDTPILGSLIECKESISKLDDLDDSSIEVRSKSDEIILSLSDYPVDIFEDKNIVTAVSSIHEENKDDKMIIDGNSNTVSKTNHPYPPNDELPNLEDALYGQLSKDAIENPLRIQNLTLTITPKQSEEKVLILKSGDSSSLVLKSKLSLNIDPKTDTRAELNILPMLSNNRIDFGFTKFPMQIATVGYALPYLLKCNSTTKIGILKNEDSILNRIKSDYITNRALGKSIQCFNGINKEPPQETCEKKEINKNKEIIENCDVCAIEVQNDIKTETIEDIKNSSISNSTSLDILVGLLNEIKKLTSYEDHLPKQENISNNFENTELEIIHNKIAIQESSIENSVINAMSLPSFDNFQILKAHTSKPKIGVYDGGKMIIDKKVTTSTSMSHRSLIVDDDTKILPAGYMQRFTEAPNRCTQLSVSTNVTDSLVKLINKSSSRSIYSFNDCESPILNQITEVSSKVLRKSIDNLFPSPILDIQYQNNKEICADITKLAIEPNNHSDSDFDSLMKMKRDILVTVYSILVLTVFAALSFPEIMYRVY